jgi:hypothetical protein
MAQFTVRITAIATNGPYCYLIVKDGAGLKDANALANISAALDAVKADIAANLAGETVKSVAMTVNSA